MSRVRARVGVGGPAQIHARTVGFVGDAERDTHLKNDISTCYDRANAKSSLPDISKAKRTLVIRVFEKSKSLTLKNAQKSSLNNSLEFPATTS